MEECKQMSAWIIFLAILVFSVIILFHEFGHFIVAKWNKVKVLEFSLGMGQSDGVKIVDTFCGVFAFANL